LNLASTFQPLIYYCAPVPGLVTLNHTFLACSLTNRFHMEKLWDVHIGYGCAMSY